MLFIDSMQIKGISCEKLSLPCGECVSLSGASGMGKSLFLKGVADLVPHDGQVRINESLRSDMSAPVWRRRVTYVAAGSAWWESKVADHFQDLDWLKEVLPLVDLSPKVAEWSVSRLSSGEAQRLCLLRALEGLDENEEHYLLLDEPTSALDAGRQGQVEDLLGRYLKAGRIGIIFVSHDERQVERFADKHWQIYNRMVREVTA